MINTEDIKIFFTGIFGNVFLWIANATDLNIYSSIFWHSAVSLATIYFLYKNHKKNNPK